MRSLVCTFLFLSVFAVTAQARAEQSPEAVLDSLAGSLVADYDRKLARVQEEVEFILRHANTLPRAAICVKLGAIANTAQASSESVVILNAVGLRSKVGGKMFLQALVSKDYPTMIENFCQRQRLPKTELIAILTELLDNDILVARNVVATVDTTTVTK